MINEFNHGLRTPNEGINQRNLKIWADVADKYASAVPKTHWSKLTLIPFLILRTFDHSSRWEMIKEFQIQAKN